MARKKKAKTRRRLTETEILRKRVAELLPKEISPRPTKPQPDCIDLMAIAAISVHWLGDNFALLPVEKYVVFQLAAMTAQQCIADMHRDKTEKK